LNILAPYESAQSDLGLRLFQEAAAAQAPVQAGMDIEANPRPAADVEATCDDPEVCRLSLNIKIVLAKA
jgi:hypothetical protein